MAAEVTNGHIHRIAPTKSGGPHVLSNGGSGDLIASKSVLSHSPSGWNVAQGRALIHPTGHPLRGERFAFPAVRQDVASGMRRILSVNVASSIRQTETKHEVSVLQGCDTKRRMLLDASDGGA